MRKWKIAFKVVIFLTQMHYYYCRKIDVMQINLAAYLGPSFMHIKPTLAVFCVYYIVYIVIF